MIPKWGDMDHFPKSSARVTLKKVADHFVVSHQIILL
jgi:hypothetical protein